MMWIKHSRVKKILVVDDDMRNTFALSSTLEDCGGSVVMSSNGQLALEVLDQERDVDIILMDIMMPIMNGIEAIEKIRLRSDYGTVPIIALTALTTFEDREMSIKAGATEFLTKPVEMENLISVITRCLQQCYTVQ